MPNGTHAAVKIFSKNEKRVRGCATHPTHRLRLLEIVMLIKYVYRKIDQIWGGQDLEDLILLLIISIISMLLSFYAMKTEEVIHPEVIKVVGVTKLESTYTGSKKSGRNLFIYVDNIKSPQFQSSCLGLTHFCEANQVSRFSSNVNVEFIALIKKDPPDPQRGIISKIVIGDNVIFQNSYENIKSSYQGRKNVYYFCLLIFVVATFYFFVFLILIIKINNQAS
ncbi:hypothetical protein [Kingella potus]|uniref:hypothetical protein n=1 Tax=Kingella potus TaxID=265175 RepID=UPI0011C048D2|nr:hypothetical protein [Kingella potus]UOP01088.1 hypothetical protein LVJ84_01655 [Kingella potus]